MRDEANEGAITRGPVHGPPPTIIPTGQPVFTPLPTTSSHLSEKIGAINFPCHRNGACTFSAYGGKLSHVASSTDYDQNKGVFRL